MISQAAQTGCSNPNTTASDAFSSGTVIRSICNRAANDPSDAIFLRSSRRPVSYRSSGSCSTAS